jgi:receptor protein-tyrosine kinase
LPEPRSPEGTPSRRRALRALRRRLPIFLLVTALVPLTSVAWSLTREKEYTAGAALLFRDSGLDQAILGTPTFRSTGDAARDAATNLRLTSLDVIADRTARRVAGETRASVRAKVAVTQQGLSSLVQIDATDRVPERAAALATTFAEEFIRFRREADRRRLADAREITKRQYQALTPAAKLTPQGRQLRDRSQQLEILASLQTGGAELVQRADVPTAPSYPRPFRNGVLGLFFGAILGLILAMLVDRLDRRIQDPDEMQEEFDKPVLAAIPHSTRMLKSGATLLASEAATAEAFRMLRANLRYFNVDRGLHVVLITSAAPGDGKSTVAANLAAASAANGARTLLIEVDLRHPTLARGLGVAASPGLTHVLARDAQLDSVVQTVPATSGAADAASGRTLDVIVAGPLPPNPTDLIESERMREILREAARDYEFVVVDTPPTAVVPDAIPLVTQVDGVVVVGRLGKSTRESLSQLRRQLDHLDAPTLGVVVNDVTLKTAGYAYGYGYGYQADPDAVDDSMTMGGDERRPQLVAAHDARGD